MCGQCCLGVDSKTSKNLEEQASFAGILKHNFTGDKI